jgi:hypothetical protein
MFSLPMFRFAVLALMLTTVSVASASPARAEDTFDVSGTVISIRGQILTIVTSDIIGREQPIMVDIVWVPDLQVQVGDPLSLTVRSREADTFLALGIVRGSPFVNGLDFGVREEFTTRQDSIEARVGNVPVDDEALAKQKRGRNLHRDEDDDERRHRR